MRKAQSIKLNFFLFALLFYSALSLTAQNLELSNQAQISIITCGPGHEELYSAFGHSALRVKDGQNGIDRVYNYGTFNFNTPNFYTKFARGKLLYELRAYNFNLFLQSYHRENRWVKEQVLNLNDAQKQNVYNYLEHNAKPENRAYKYDFFYDNCSTKIYDVLKEILKDDLSLEKDFKSLEMSHRDLIQLYLGSHPWGDFGIDLALGAVIDKEADSKDYLFLPDYVLYAFNDTKIKQDGVQVEAVLKQNNLLKEKSAKKNYMPLTPLVLFSILAILVIWFTYQDFKQNKTAKWLDFIILFISGITGVLMLLLWFATDHSATAQNFNILWAFAPNLIVAFTIFKQRPWHYYYWFGLVGLLDILLVLWFIHYQVFSIAIIPILIMLYTRYLYNWQRLRKKQVIL